MSDDDDDDDDDYIRWSTDSAITATFGFLSATSPSFSEGTKIHMS